MATQSPPPFTQFVPGFEFFEGLMKSGSAASAPMAQWMSPTLDPKALGERIEQLKTVQFWLEQNTRMLQASIQALEVQRMTLATLESMNVPVSQWAQAFSAPSGPAAATQPSPSKPTNSTAAPAVDPLQWWSALTQQFSTLASQALAGTRPTTSAKTAPPPPARKKTSSSAGTARRRSAT